MGKNHGQCRPDLECVFAPMELIGTCQVKKHKGDCTTFNDEGFDETHGAICKGNTDKVLNDFFDADFQEENLSNCKKFCNCIKHCKGFNFNPNSNKRKCSWKTDSPIETFTNAGIERSGQSCVIKGLQLENGEESLVGGYGSGAENGSYGMGGGYESGSGSDASRMGGAYGSGLEGGSIGGSYGMGGGYRSEGGNGANGMGGGYGSEFGSGVPDCLDELPSDYSDSVCYKQWDETSCEKIASDPNQCDILWRDTTCSQHRGRVRDTCRKSC